MNLLSPTIFPDNTEVNGKMKMKCLNVNGSNINEIVTGPKIVYRSGERSFLKSISIDGYRITISYIDDLFQGAAVEAVFRQNGIDVIYVSLYPNGNANISGGSYNSVCTARRASGTMSRTLQRSSGHPYWDVRKSWKTISFNIAADIQDGYMKLQNKEGLFVGGTLTLSQGLLPLCGFDFVLPPPSEHTLYSSFISDMKYISGNAEVIKIIDGEGKNDDELLDIAKNNKPCLIINNSPSSSTDPNILTLVLNNSTTPNPVFYRAISSVRGESTDGTPSLVASAASLNALKARSAEIQRINDRVDELENKLRKFGIE